MDAKELRIGNYVKDHLGRFQKVSETRSNAYICYLSNGHKLKYKLNTTNPIPLTEEWLVKFGFVKDKLEVGLYHFNDLEIFLPNYFTWKTQFLNNIKHVHQLQNLYFALTNEELKLK